MLGLFFALFLHLLHSTRLRDVTSAPVTCILTIGRAVAVHSHQQTASHIRCCIDDAYGFTCSSKCTFAPLTLLVNQEDQAASRVT